MVRGSVLVLYYHTCVTVLGVRISDADVEMSREVPHTDC